MCDQKARRSRMANKTTIRVELVDNWHARWPAVLQAIASCGQLEALSIDADGWLSARQVLLVACAPDNFVAGHLCFRLVPAADLAGNVEVEAHLQAIGVSEILPAAQAARVAGALTSAARKRARALRCQRLVGFAA